ncbi:MAG: YfjI family protein [Candidatus Eremiobacteraeota bacterium]|nr:YfjI family protein [Candidatus Eremiobacteraeota bacterium]
MFAGVLGRAGIHPKQHDDDWIVVPNLWGAIVARPGLMKSPAMHEALKPFQRLASKATERFKEEQLQSKERRDILSLQVTAIESSIKSGHKKGDDVSELEQKLTAVKREIESCSPVERRYFTQDATPEKLAELLRENPRGIAIIRDELAGWLKTMDRPGHEGERQFHLEGWNGSGQSYTYDRIGRGTIHVPALCTSVLGGIQPGRLAEYIAEANGNGGGADGLLQRLQVLVWPDEFPDWKNIDRYPDVQAKQRAFAIVAALDEIDPASIVEKSGGARVDLREPIQDGLSRHYCSCTPRSFIRRGRG